MKADVLVTGGSSPLGDHVLPALVAAYPRVVATARSEESTTRLTSAGANVVPLDLAAAALSCEVRAPLVVHLAGIRFARPVAALTRAVGAEALVAVSSASAAAVGHPAREDVLRGEDELRGGVPSVSVLRPTMIYGSARDRNVQRLYRFSQRLGRVPRISGGGRIMPVLVDDVVEALLEVMASPAGDVRPVGGPVPVRLGELVDEICRAGGLHRIPVRIPLSPVVTVASLFGNRAGKAVHALQMLSSDRLVDPPGQAGFRYSPTSLGEGVALAVRRYDKGGAS